MSPTRCPDCGKLLGTSSAPVAIRPGPCPPASDAPSFETKCPRCSALLTLTFAR